MPNTLFQRSHNNSVYLDQQLTFSPFPHNIHNLSTMSITEGNKKDTSWIFCHYNVRTKANFLWNSEYKLLLLACIISAMDSLAFCKTLLLPLNSKTKKIYTSYSNATSIHVLFMLQSPVDCLPTPCSFKLETMLTIFCFLSVYQYWSR